MQVKVFVHVCMHTGIQRPTLLFAPILLFSFKLGRPINVFVFGQCCFIASPYFSLFPLAQHEMWLLNRKSYKTNIPLRYQVQHIAFCVICLFNSTFLPIRYTAFMYWCILAFTTAIPQIPPPLPPPLKNINFWVCIINTDPLLQPVYHSKSGKTCSKCVRFVH